MLILYALTTEPHLWLLPRICLIKCFVNLTTSEERIYAEIVGEFMILWNCLIKLVGATPIRFSRNQSNCPNFRGLCLWLCSWLKNQVSLRGLLFFEIFSLAIKQGTLNPWIVFANLSYGLINSLTWVINVLVLRLMIFFVHIILPSSVVSGVLLVNGFEELSS